MPDNKFRAIGGRESLAVDDFHPITGDTANPLASLARMIGQTNPHSDAAVAGVDWCIDADPDDQNRHWPHAELAPSPSRSYQSDESQERSCELGPVSRSLFELAAKYNGFRDDDGEHTARNELEHWCEQTMPPNLALPAFMAPPANNHKADEPQQHGDQGYGADLYQDDPPVSRHRGGLVVVVAILGLAVVGSAGAFGYRSMFGHFMLPTMPLIKSASSYLGRIVPSAGDGNESHSSQPGVAEENAAEILATRVDQGAKLEPVLPRVFATIPVPSGEGPESSVAIAPANEVPPPDTLGTAPSVAAAVAPVSAVTLAAPSSTEPKKIHTLRMRADQPSNSTAPSAGPAGSRVVRPSKPNTTASAAPAKGNAPLSILPGTGSDATASAGSTHVRAAFAAASGPPLKMASTTPVTGTTATGGYAVQFTSYRSEADAKAAFQTLQSKFPDQLGGREPILRRVDLGAKGVYYRALVGPFALMNEAAAMCSRLKAAGANCVLQRN